MNRIILAFSTLFLVIGCTDDFSSVVDFTEVENPNLSEGSVIGQPNSSVIWLSGLERQLSLAINNTLVLAELGSDNYVNTQTFFSQFMDELDIRVTDPNIRNAAFTVQRLREMAVFGLTQVGPADPEYVATTEAEYHFFYGISLLYSAMYFSALPQEPVGIPISSAQNYRDAIAAFDLAIGLNPLPEYHLAKARANYYLGNKADAVAAAQQALALDGSFDRFATFDQANGPTNTMEAALFARGTFDDLQPLPTLDFLDPKYSFLTAEEDPPVHYLKAEEAHLILAEANISDGNIAAAQDDLRNLLDLVATREVRSIDDSIEGRTENAPGSRPDNAGVAVNFRGLGLVLDRQAGNVDIPAVSGTSLTEFDVDMMVAGDNAVELLYRTRQEVFIAEGIRFVDMGIKLVIDENEILQNDNISMGDPGTVPVIPPFIAAVVTDLDAITYDATAGVATTVVDVTQILVGNKESDLVLPFH